MIIFDLAAYLYADDGLVESTQLKRLQRAFDVLTGLFGRFGLMKNTAKTFGMVYQPCHAPGGMSEATYALQVMGKVPTSWERQRIQVECPD